MPGRMRRNPLVTEIRDTLRRIGPLVSDNSITSDKITKIHQLTKAINRRIVSGGDGI